MNEIELDALVPIERGLVSACWGSLREARLLQEIAPDELSDYHARAGLIAIRSIISRGEDPTMIVVRHEMARSNDIESFLVLASGDGACWTDGEIRAAVARVRSECARRRVLRTFSRLEQEIARTKSLEALQETVTREISLAFSSVRRAEAVEERVAAEELADHLLRLRQEEMTGSKNTSVLPTGFADLDSIIEGGSPEDLIIIGARPRVGKSALALQIAREWARYGNVYYASGEMSRRQLVQRAASQDYRLPKSQLSAAHMLEFAETRARSLFFDDRSATMAELCANVETFALRKPLVAVIIDYLQLYCPTEYAAVSEASKKALRLARSLKIPVVALAQLSRGVDSRDNKRPVLSDLKESGQIEQDAHKILMLYREHIYTGNRPNYAECWVRKNREGDSDVCARMHWDGPTTSFGRWSGDEQRPRNPALRDIPDEAFDVY